MVIFYSLLYVYRRVCAPGDWWHGGRGPRLEHWFPNPNHGCFTEGPAGVKSPGSLGLGIKTFFLIFFRFYDVCMNLKSHVWLMGFRHRPRGMRNDIVSQEEPEVSLSKPP